MYIKSHCLNSIISYSLSQPAEVNYNTSFYKHENITHENQVGPLVSHVYSIRNKGPSDILEAEAVFLWPSYTLAGKDFFNKGRVIQILEVDFNDFYFRGSPVISTRTT